MRALKNTVSNYLTANRGDERYDKQRVVVEGDERGSAEQISFLMDSCHGWPIPLRECRCSTGEPTKGGGKSDEKR